MPIRLASLLDLARRSYARGRRCSHGRSRRAGTAHGSSAGPIASAPRFDAGPDAGVDEQIIAEPAGIVEALEKRHMLSAGSRCGSRPALPALCRRSNASPRHSFRDIERRRTAASWRSATASPAMIRSSTSSWLPSRIPANAVLVIGSQPLDHLGGAGPAVDQVAEEHQQVLARGPLHRGRARSASSRRSSRSSRPWTSPTT